MQNRDAVRMNRDAARHVATKNLIAKKTQRIQGRDAMRINCGTPRRY